MLPASTGYGWNGSRYYSFETGRFVSASSVRDALENIIDASAANMNALTQQLTDGGISLANWQKGMMKEIKLAHTAAAASSQGGWAQLTQSDWGATGQMIRTQYDYLRNFASQIASGEQPLDGRALVRADMYGQAPRGTYEEMHRRYEAQVNGAEEERRILEVSDGANCVDCLDAAELDWQPIGTLPRIGDSACQTNCRCSMEFRRAGEGEE